MPSRFSPHPLYVNYGEKVLRQTACQHLNLSEEIHYLLFFGIIRDYKGLDVLIDAWKLLKEKGLTTGKKVLIVGEYYNNKEKYVTQMEQLGVTNDFIIHDYFVQDEEVKYFFSAADVVVQPYKNATQSGVTQIAYQFEVPMIVTNVGGLAEIVPHDKVGYVTEPTAEAICQAIEQFYDSDIHRFANNIKEERKRFTWEALTEQFESLYQELS
jgi:glycosyltransferase involved in cell wall biosynthesis